MSAGEDTIGTRLVAAASAANPQSQGGELVAAAKTEAAQHEFAGADGAAALKTALGKSSSGDALVLSIVAELAKNEALREPLGEHGIVAATVEALNRAAADKPEDSEARALCRAAQVHALRALGNLCFDHNANRERLRDAGGLGAIQSVLDRAAQDDSQGGTSGGDENDDGDQETSSGGVPPGLTLAMAGSGALLNAAADSEAIQTSLLEAGAIPSLLWVIQHAATPAEREMGLRALGQFTSAAGLEKIAASGGIRALVDKLPTITDDDYEDSDVPEMLRSLSNADNTGPLFAKDKVMKDLVLIACQRTSRASQLAALMVSVLISFPECLKEVYDDEQSGDKLISLCMDWMKSDVLDMRVSGALGIGNICRSDAASKRLAAFPGLVPALISLMSQDTASTQHAACGALKNLSNFAPNKRILLDAGIAPILLDVVNSPHTPMQYTASSLIRGLCLTGKAEDVAQFTELEGLIERLVHLGRDEQEAIRAEGTRALINFIKFGADPALNARLVQNGAIENLLTLLKSKHPMLQGEAVLGLVLLATSSDDCRKAVGDSQTLEMLPSLLEETQQMDIKCNGLTLIGSLLQDQQLRDSEDGAKALEVVRKLKDDSNETVKGQAVKVLDLVKA
eukprot:m.300329 g.300329  ORF g.300329 m.300329 type:complete len:626 (+) comp14422_c0_seq1:105-1982(+)